MSITAPQIAMVAGEASGDLLASLILPSITQQWPQSRLFGVGGPLMTKHGFDAQWPSDQLAVRGYIEVLKHYNHIVGIRNQLKEQWTAQKPDVFIGVDVPDFNLNLAQHLKKNGVPTMHLVCPSIWAWRAQRVHNIQKSVDHVLCIFPFETELLAKHGIEATFIGHPLAQVIPMNPDQSKARAALGLSSEDKVVCVMPGSRTSEIEQMLDRFLKACQLMLGQSPRLQFVLPTLPAFQQRITEKIAQYQLTQQMLLLDGQSHTALAACDVAMVASGTATLEAALFKRPMVIAYHMPWISWQIIRRQKLQEWVGLPNILCQSFVVPELIQDKAQPQNLVHEVLQCLDQPKRCQMMQSRFHELHQTLLKDTSQLALHAIQKILTR
ncbi:MAG: lipid-A-disaccharide synthase [Limnohabitans sp.]|nr:lipid-A-disaccharide synthase [Limnohabitans sp.]